MQTLLSVSDNNKAHETEFTTSLVMAELCWMGTASWRRSGRQGTQGIGKVQNSGIGICRGRRRVEDPIYGGLVLADGSLVEAHVLE